jgi:hypothetical protein
MLLIEKSAFEAIAWLSFPGPDHRGLILALAAYFDDAGTHEGSPVVSWGGFIGMDTEWSRFDGAWRAKLAQPLDGKPRLRKFGLADCQAKRGEFAGYSVAESDLIQNEFRAIIVRHRLLGMAFAVDRPIWDRLITGAAREHLGDAEVVCFASCFNGAIARAIEYFPDESMLSLHFDRGRLSPKLSAVVDTVTRNYSGKPEIVSISFDPVEKFTPLQAADVIATENYWHAKGWLEGKIQPRPHLAHFLERVSTEGYILDEPMVRKTLRSHGFS